MSFPGHFDGTGSGYPEPLKWQAGLRLWHWRREPPDPPENRLREGHPGYTRPRTQVAGGDAQANSPTSTRPGGTSELLHIFMLPGGRPLSPTAIVYLTCPQCHVHFHGSGRGAIPVVDFLADKYPAPAQNRIQKTPIHRSRGYASLRPGRESISSAREKIPL